MGRVELGDAGALDGLHARGAGFAVADVEGVVERVLHVLHRLREVRAVGLAAVEEELLRATGGELEHELGALGHDAFGEGEEVHVVAARDAQVAAGLADAGLARDFHFAGEERAAQQVAANFFALPKHHAANADDNHRPADEAAELAGADDSGEIHRLGKALGFRDERADERGGFARLERAGAGELERGDEASAEG